MSSRTETSTVEGAKLKTEPAVLEKLKSAPKWLFDLQELSQKSAKSQWKRPSCRVKLFILQK